MHKRTLLLSLFAILAGSQAFAAGDATRGAEVYQDRCSQCHGVDGEADGAAADRSWPRPRIFRDFATYKIRTTPVGELPTDQDLFDIISNGLPGTSMPPFDVLPAQDRWDAVAFIKTMAEDFSDPDYIATAVSVPEVTLSEAPASSAEAVTAGAALFEENCIKCHGLTGRGDGEQWDTMEEKWSGTRMLPSNLTNPESYRGGSGALDIFRSITTGIDGTPMPSHLENLSTDERWQLTHFVRSLQTVRWWPSRQRLSQKAVMTRAGRRRQWLASRPSRTSSSLRGTSGPVCSL